MDTQGYAYVAGETLSTDFPTTLGTLDDDANGGYDAFVTKLSTSGQSLEYSTYLGGANSDAAYVCYDVLNVHD